MPILVKDFTWEETESTVFIDVPLKGVASNKVDIFSAGQYLKVLKAFLVRYFNWFISHNVLY